MGRYKNNKDGTLTPISTSGAQEYFLGTTTQWNALTAEQKAKYDGKEVHLTDDAIQSIIAPNAGSHNSIYRGKYLGSSVTAAQYASISAGTFEDLFIGDYWTISGVNYRIAAFDYWLHTGDTECTTHHVVLVPDTSLVTKPMNGTSTTTYGYAGTDMRDESNTNGGIYIAKGIIDSAFSSPHILSHRELITNAVTSGVATGWVWVDSTVILMNETMVYGCTCGSKPVADSVDFNIGIDKSQLPLFALEPSRICNSASWWLRSVVSASLFAVVDSSGVASRVDASGTFGVRPAFAIIG